MSLVKVVLKGKSLIIKVKAKAKLDVKVFEYSSWLMLPQLLLTFDTATVVTDRVYRFDS